MGYCEVKIIHVHSTKWLSFSLAIAAIVGWSNPVYRWESKNGLRGCPQIYGQACSPPARQGRQGHQCLKLNWFDAGLPLQGPFARVKEHEIPCQRCLQHPLTQCFPAGALAQVPRCHPPLTPTGRVGLKKHFEIGELYLEEGLSMRHHTRPPVWRDRHWRPWGDVSSLGKVKEREGRKHDATAPNFKGARTDFHPLIFQASMPRFSPSHWGRPMMPRNKLRYLQNTMFYQPCSAQMAMTVAAGGYCGVDTGMLGARNVNNVLKRPPSALAWLIFP